MINMCSLLSKEIPLNYKSKDIKWSRKRYNKKLEKIAEMCKIDTDLTSYVSRHSFATEPMLQQVAVNAISAMLPEKNEPSTTINITDGHENKNA